MFCSQCGTRLDLDAKFCTKCGTRVAQETSAPIAPASQQQETLPLGMPPVAQQQETLPLGMPPLEPKQETLPLGMPPLEPQPPAFAPQPQEPFGDPAQPAFETAPPARGQLSKQTMGLIALCLVIIVGGLLYYFNSNGGSSQKTPEKTVESFMKAFKNKDAKALVKVISDDALGNPDKDEMKDIIKQMNKRFDGGSLKSYKILDTEIDDDGKTATVDYKVTYKDEDGDVQSERDSFDLVKIGGKWYLDENMGF